MKIRDHRPLIIKTLKESTGTFKTIEDFADHLIARVEQAEEVLEMYGGGLLINVPKSEGPMPITSVAKKTASPVDISERIRAENTGALKENFTKQEIREYLDQALPQDIEVQPNGFEKPIKLFRRLENAPGDLNFVRIKYVPQGADMGAETMLASTEAVLDAEKVMQEILGSAEAVLSPKQRRIEPRHATPPLASLEQGLSATKEEGAVVAETDKDQSGADLSNWVETVKKSSNDPRFALGNQFRSQRGG